MRPRLLLVACVSAFIALLLLPAPARAFNLFPAHWGQAETQACSEKEVREAKERALLTSTCPDHCGAETNECSACGETCPTPPPVDRGTPHGPLGIGTAAAIRRAVDRAVATAKDRLQSLHFPGGSKKNDETENQGEVESSDAHLTSLSEILDDLQRQLFLAAPTAVSREDMDTHNTPLSALARASRNVMHVFPNLHLSEPASDSHSAFRSAMDVSENEHEVEFIADVPGAEDKDIVVEVLEDPDLGSPVLVVKGTRELTVDVDDDSSADSKNKNDQKVQTKITRLFHRRERHFGSFENRYALPVTVDVSRITAQTSKGVLTIIAPKKNLKPKDTNGGTKPVTKNVVIESL